LIRAHPRSRSTANRVLNAILDGRHTLLLSSEIIAETGRVLRYPRLQKIYFLNDEEVYEYTQFLGSISELVQLDQPYHAPIRDPKDLDVMQTAERGDADLLCTNDSDFHTPAMIGFCSTRGIKVCNEAALLLRLLH
jgi:putative PIN family toxin of toxin-antitoxin system